MPSVCGDCVYNLYISFARRVTQCEADNQTITTKFKRYCLAGCTAIDSTAKGGWAQTNAFWRTFSHICPHNWWGGLIGGVGVWSTPYKKGSFIPTRLSALLLIISCQQNTLDSRFNIQSEMASILAVPSMFLCMLSKRLGRRRQVQASKSCSLYCLGHIAIWFCRV